MNNYFDTCKTVDETRKLYVSLAKILHPDIGGSDKEFQELGNQYEAKLKSLNGSYNSKEDEKEGKRQYRYDSAIEKDLMNMLRAVQGLQLPETVKIELKGCWLWVSGTTANRFKNYPLDSRHIPSLERLGLKFHSMKGECYYRDQANACQNKGKILSSDRVSKRYGAYSVSNSGSEQVGA